MAANTDQQKLLLSTKNQMEQQLTVARSELKNLRQQVRSLGFAHQKEIEKIQEILKAPEVLTGAIKKTTSPTVATADECNVEEKKSDSVTFQIIGFVSSWFGEKRGTPRQPGVCRESQAKLTLNKNVFTNPEHTLEGLSCFSHMWLIFHFHKNNTTRVQAKVSPPRLNGGRVGVFGTRSPHRPAPIGLSLVKIEKIEDATIFFSGVDVVDGTPVLDIKPYIPHYDSPWCLGQEEEEVEEKEQDSPVELGPMREAATGSSSDEELNVSSTHPSPITPNRNAPNIREAPDGEEEGLVASSNTPTSGPTCRISPTPNITDNKVRVPTWIDQPPVARLVVRFSERAVMQLVDTATANTKDMVSAISSVLREDPRSVYLRERWSSHFYTFLIRDLHISCKFDDKARSVTVFQVRSAKKCEVCGEMEWQCVSNGNCQQQQPDKE